MFAVFEKNSYRPRKSHRSRPCLPLWRSASLYWSQDIFARIHQSVSRIGKTSQINRRHIHRRRHVERNGWRFHPTLARANPEIWKRDISCQTSPWQRQASSFATSSFRHQRITTGEKSGRPDQGNYWQGTHILPILQAFAVSGGTIWRSIQT